jgi:hypothetical protein
METDSDAVEAADSEVSQRGVALHANHTQRSTTKVSNVERERASEPAAKQ